MAATMGGLDRIMNCSELLYSKPEVASDLVERAVFVDGVHEGQVDELVTFIRSCLACEGSSPKFVLVPRDLKAEQHLISGLLGVISQIELPPIQVAEHLKHSKPLQTASSTVQHTTPRPTSINSPPWKKETIWLRGGLPESLNADSDGQSYAWRKEYIESLVKQDFSGWGIDASDRLPDVLQWIANNNGEQFDDAKCATSLSVKKESVRRSLDLLERIGLLRRLENWPARSNQSMSKLPVFYIRDSGLLHAMLGIDTLAKLRESGSIGHSWEGFSIEAIINSIPPSVISAYYRDRDRNEIDLVLNSHDGEVYAIEVKLNEQTKAKKGFGLGCAVIGATKKLVVHSGETDQTSEGGVPRLTLPSALKSLPQRSHDK
ncbi:ATP-binding protein [Sulfitobacter delicatus]|uniref:ATP-binding protein n=1 Tax=Sulfitobacter delicatus TaxID=218672 RepID=UPI0014288C13|nr:DUF4143 domain-containing protein [Sulfitobacter delicatus]